MFVATRLGIQVCADDGPTQVILPVPDRSRVIGVCFGGPDLNTLFAFCGDKVWKRESEGSWHRGLYPMDASERHETVIRPCRRCTVGARKWGLCLANGSYGWHAQNEVMGVAAAPGHALR